MCPLVFFDALRVAVRESVGYLVAALNVRYRRFSVNVNNSRRAHIKQHRRWLKARRQSADQLLRTEQRRLSTEDDKPAAGSVARVPCNSAHGLILHWEENLNVQNMLTSPFDRIRRRHQAQTRLAARFVSLCQSWQIAAHSSPITSTTSPSLPAPHADRIQRLKSPTETYRWTSSHHALEGCQTQSSGHCREAS